MMQAGLPSSPAPSVSSQATSSSASSCSSSKGFVRSNISHFFYNFLFYFNSFFVSAVQMVNHLLSEKEYEEAFFTACNTVYGPRGHTEAPAGVIAVYESQKSHIEQVCNAGKALQQSADSGNESAKFIYSEHYKAQEMSHYRSKEDALLLYLKTFNQSVGHELQFVENYILMERARISHDQMTHILLGQIRASSEQRFSSGAYRCRKHFNRRVAWCSQEVCLHKVT